MRGANSFRVPTATSGFCDVTMGQSLPLRKTGAAMAQFPLISKRCPCFAGSTPDDLSRTSASTGGEGGTVDSPIRSSGRCRTCHAATPPNSFFDAITVIRKNDRSRRGKAAPGVPAIQNDHLTFGKLIEPLAHLRSRDFQRPRNLPSPRGAPEADINQGEVLVAGIYPCFHGRWACVGRRLDPKKTRKQLIG
jgi:hypothetical protein